MAPDEPTFGEKGDYPGSVVAYLSNSLGFTLPGDSAPVAVWKIPQFQAAKYPCLSDSPVHSACHRLK
jgi:hypothetical protein